MDLREAINAVSDVINNRPKGIREFDQIHMKTADMLLQAEIIASWAKDKKLAFIGDGDAVSVCVAYLMSKNVIEKGPSYLHVFDFDERVVEAVNQFAKRENINFLKASLYNCIDKFEKVGEFDNFYTNPPWGKYNSGNSICLFAKRGLEAIGFNGYGVLVIADAVVGHWSNDVMKSVQKFLCENECVINQLQKEVHSYHLDDEPDLKSSNVFFNIKRTIDVTEYNSADISDRQELNNFYGENKRLIVKYVRSIEANKKAEMIKKDYELEYLDGDYE